MHESVDAASPVSCGSINRPEKGDPLLRKVALLLLLVPENIYENFAV